MKLPEPPSEYNKEYEYERNKEIEQADLNNQKRNTDIILTSSNGSAYKLSVDNSGNLSASALTASSGSGGSSGVAYNSGLYGQGTYG